MTMPNQDSDLSDTSTTEGTTSSATGEGNQPASGRQSGTGSQDWQAKYQGLQRAFQKAKDDADAQIKDLQAKIADATAQTEAALQAASGTEQQRTVLEATKAQLESSLQQAQQERDALSAKLTRQSILLKEFPDLAPLADFIPSAENDDNFRTSAENFRSALRTYVESAVREKFSGSTPVTQSGKNEIPSTAEEERLWAKVYATAGVPGKEAEYEDANRQLQELINSKTR